ncbi:MAG: Eco57I restriction-modification methylase domain-containing protein [Acidimicrobiales bacterium]
MVDYRHLGAEELGGIYEGLLEYVPRHDRATRSFTLASLAGNDRKKTGAYYTPSSLTECLLDTALDPLLDRAERSPDPEAALLGLTVCDPACGSGHFLVAAARRIAARLAAVRAGEAEPSLEDIQVAMHDVVGRCCYGVDVNPLAAELAKVSLWLEGLQAGAALSLLDAHIKVGNALLGTTPALLAEGIPEAAFAAITGDDKRIAGELKARNKREHAGHDDLFASAGVTVAAGHLADRVAAIEALPARSLADVHVAERRLAELDGSPEARHARLVADAWCAAFVMAKLSGAPALTQADLLRLDRGESDEKLVAAVEAEAQRYRFFHWHLEFPKIFAGEAGGFDCVIGNPPWERVKLQEQEWFAARLPAIVEAPNAAARKRLIAELATERPELHGEFLAARRQAEGESHLIRSGGRYPLAGRGDINTYAIFAEADRGLLADTGRLGVILPTGIATDATTQYFFKDLVTSRSLVSLYDFENRDRIFDAVDSRVKFCLLTLSGSAAPADVASFAFFARHPDDLARAGTRFALTPEEITLLNPNTGTCPVFRSRRDAEITLGIYRRHPVLVRKGDPDGNPWGVSFMTMFHMSNDSGLFRTRAELELDGWILDGNVFRRGDDAMLPLYEAKMVHHYDHRWATYTGADVRDTTQAEHADAAFTVLPRYWVAAKEVHTRLAERSKHEWLLGFRNITNTTNERTLICAAFPMSGVGNSMPLLLADRSPHLLAVTASSSAADFVVRQKLGGTNLNFFYVEQLPVPAPATFGTPCAWSVGQTVQDWIEDRVDELIYTAWDMAPAALALGDDGAPFVWDPGRRAVLRAELDGAFFHLYGVERDDVEYILGTFPIANRKDPGLAGRVLDAYDRIATAIEKRLPFVSVLDPPPGEGRRHEGAE